MASFSIPSNEHEVTGAVRPGCRWVEPTSIEEGAVRALRESLGLPALFCQLLVRRGCHDPEAARGFLRPRLDGLPAASLLPDLAAAVSRIEKAIASGEPILVHGDYDVDGMTGAALLARGLEELGGRVEAFVPHRLRDGYDLGPAGLRRADELGARLIVTVDCGTTAHAAIAAARAAARDVIVTDHHRPDVELPAAIAVVNPHRADSGYPFRGLTGAGVAFKLLTALSRSAGRPEGMLNRHLDLVAIGTIADRGPLVDENRALVRAGLRALARTQNRGLWSLLLAARVAPFGGRVAADDVAFRLAPRLNAAGRVGAAEEGLRLLLTEDAAEADALASRLEDHNRRRRATDRQVTEEAEARLDEAPPGPAVVLWSDDWHPGVIGIVASKLAARTGTPAVVIAFDGDLGRGSARSAGGVNLIQVLDECAPLLERHGGHREAAGLDVRRERVEEFRQLFVREVARRAGQRLGRHAEDDPRAAGQPQIDLEIDLEVTLEDAVGTIGRWMKYLEPFGYRNRRPILLTRGVRFDGPLRVGQDGSHVRAELVGRGDVRLPTIGFGMGQRAEELRQGVWDVVFEPLEDHWRGRRRLQARLLDARRA